MTFGSIPSGTNSVLYLAITNNRSQPIQFTVSELGKALGSSGGSGTVGAYSTNQFPVTFSPPAPGNYNTTYQISSASLQSQISISASGAAY